MPPLGDEHRGEYGWSGTLLRAPVATPIMRFDPKLDDAEQGPFRNKYQRSPVPKGMGMKLLVANGKWISLDDVAFGYDVWFEASRAFFYTSWLGVSCQQDPHDAWNIQEMIYDVKPDVIVEVGTNTGGGAIFYASIMRDYTDTPHVVTLDIKPAGVDWGHTAAKRACPRCISGPEHPLWQHVSFVKGDVTKPDILAKVRALIDGPAPQDKSGGGGVASTTLSAPPKVVLCIEDASHIYESTLANSIAIAPFVTVGSYLLIQDTKLSRFVTEFDPKVAANAKLGPMPAVDDFLAHEAGKGFRIDRRYERLIYSQHHRGYLRRVS